MPSRAKQIYMNDDSISSTKTFLESPDKKSIFVFRDGEMQKYAL